MLQIYIKNNIRIRGASTPLRAAVTKALTKDNPAYITAKQKRRPTWGIDSKLELFVQELGDIIAPRGFEDELNEILIKQGIEPSKVTTRDQAEGLPVDFGVWNDDFKLRGYQEPFIEELVKANGVGIAPAGAGKTIMGCKVIHRVGRATLWLTHTTDLMYQTEQRAKATMLGVGEVGIIGDSKIKWGDGKLIIATVQTLQANPQLIEALDRIIGLVVIDEAHHFPAPQFIETAGKFSAARILGLTATPDRKDRLECYMYAGIGPQLYAIDRKHLYDGGSLLKPEVKFIYTNFVYEQASIKDDDTENVDAGGEALDYIELLNKLINDQARTQLVASNILDYAHHGTSIVLTESVRYCFYLKEYVAKEAVKRGWAVPRMAVVHGGLQRNSWKVASSEKVALDMIDAGTALQHKYDAKAKRWKVKVPNYSAIEMETWQVTGAQRKQILDDVRAKKYDILFATQLAREGLDIDHLTVEHMAMPKRGDDADKNNGASVEQEIGRIQRPDPRNPGKAPILIDYVDYNVGVFQSQYSSRRKVYKRLGLNVPAKPRTPREKEIDIIDAFLTNLPL